MKRLVITAFLVVILTGILAVPTMAAAPTLHKVTGGGGVLMVTDGDEAFRSVGFTAQQIDESGGAKGEFVCCLRNYDPKLRIKADILYLAVAGNKAWLGGIVTQSNVDRISVGDGMCFEVVDNGQGSKATGPDKISYIDVGVNPADALLMYDMALLDFVKGNIQVS